MTKKQTIGGYGSTKVEYHLYKQSDGLKRTVLNDPANLQGS